VRSDADGAALRERASGRLTPVRLDVTDADQIAAAAARIEEATGSRGLDAVVNNAGVAIAGALEFLPLDQLRRQLEINVIGQVGVMQAMMPALRRAKGRVVFIGSVSGRSALPFTGAYAASKHALEAIADSLRVELRPFGMHVVIIEPGVIATPIWETSIRAGDEILERMPPELERYYGKRIAAVRRMAEKGMGGLPPSAVADVVVEAVTARTPRTRYVIGRDARLRLWLERLAPDRLRDALIARRLERM
jgi:NAD(P)-dependent dehydrogenase (short-subunit alcohol dehydrogenase family)